MTRSVTTGRGATTGCSTSRTVTSTGRVTRTSRATSPVAARAHAYSASVTLRMARSVATAIQEGNPGTLTGSPVGATLLGHMPEGEPRARLLHLAIWLATLFFAAMLFVPLVREALRRASALPLGGPF